MFPFSHFIEAFTSSWKCGKISMVLCGLLCNSDFWGHFGGGGGIELVVCISVENLALCSNK